MNMSTRFRSSRAIFVEFKSRLYCRIFRQRFGGFHACPPCSTSSTCYISLLWLPAAFNFAMRITKRSSKFAILLSLSTLLQPINAPLFEPSSSEPTLHPQTVTLPIITGSQLKRHRRYHLQV
ncbi:hypothetical protein CPB86DRAFT_452705 [Serendipita vermifera]|nr:hypothetical protein CPB86DRAFT_452705 [Serendipita vermifera]